MKHRFAKGCCLECGRDLAPLELRETAKFCTTEHRKQWNNRRMIRGGELYDLLMANRYERGWAKDEKLLTIISGLTRAFRDSDKMLREGRLSWDAHETLARLPMAFGEEGDKR